MIQPSKNTRVNIYRKFVTLNLSKFMTRKNVTHKVSKLLTGKDLMMQKFPSYWPGKVNIIKYTKLNRER